MLKILQGWKSMDNIRQVTFVCLCIAHMLQCISRKLTRLAPGKKDKQRRQFTLTLFAFLARSTSLEQAVDVYRHMFTMLRSENRTAATVRSERFVANC